MCCLFGVLDYGGSLSTQQRTKLLSVLATQSEVRGQDATGIAYNSGGQLRIFKRPKAAHELRFRLPHDATCLMGHTRMATQGDEKMNYNNHPFAGQAGGVSFALAHNGVIHNDHTLRSEQGLPQTVVETDSYISVQLLEREGVVDCSSLARVTECLHGGVHQPLRPKYPRPSGTGGAAHRQGCGVCLQKRSHRHDDTDGQVHADGVRCGG